MRQEQDGGDGSTNNQAGRDVNNITIIQGVTEERAREISQTVSRETVLREGRAVAETVINERVEYLTNLIFELIKRIDTKIFNRFEDPRFLAALTSAQRGYAETGDTDLANELASLIVGLAAQPVRSRNEIFLRQAIEVAKQLTTEHISALSVQTYLTNFKLGEPYFEPEWLINALNTLLSPYYGKIPDSPLDYQYMASMGACYADQLRSFASGPYKILHDRYTNAMYPSLTTADVEELISPENPDCDEFEKLLGYHAASQDDVREQDGVTLVTVTGARFRLTPEAAVRVFARARDVGMPPELTPAEQRLHDIISPRMLSTDEFKNKIAELKPELAEFLDSVQRAGLLNYHLLPVGLVLAQHEIQDRAPQLAAVIDEAIANGRT